MGESNFCSVDTLFEMQFYYLLFIIYSFYTGVISFDFTDLLCESEKREHFDLTLGVFFAKNWSFFPLYLFYCYFRKAVLQKQSVNLSFLAILLAVWRCQS